VASSGQLQLFDTGRTTDTVSEGSSSTFVDNMRLPVHRWFRYSAGFSARWAEALIAESVAHGPTRVFDPFAGSGTTLIAAEDMGVTSCGIEAHPFICRVARAKLERRSSPQGYRDFAERVLKAARGISPVLDGYPPLIRKCYEDDALAGLDRLRRAYEQHADGSVPAELTWLTLASILRRVSHVGTAQWQYVLPNKSKKNPLDPFVAFRGQIDVVYRDMCRAADVQGPRAQVFASDARTCEGVPAGFATLVVTSPPYTNNYDYADATRLEMSFFGEIQGWGDLQSAVRERLVCSCSQHVPPGKVDLNEVLQSPELEPIRAGIAPVCEELQEIRKTKGGKKTYHLMVACYFRDMARTWHSLRRVCDSPCRVCYVIGDSAPYGVYVPVIQWMGDLAVAAGFRSHAFEKTRDRNIKWKNRKHRVPLCEGRLWVEG
jgi:hypothetical protein